ncbi:hypothetical protein [Prosthecomicrobium sp. N25]|uniref:hypothetical protein n=1 Tax=Prosthecomicrobium sp. N25 TaxID=3129254 RepID=UPI003077575E
MDFIEGVALSVAVLASAAVAGEILVEETRRLLRESGIGAPRSAGLLEDLRATAARYQRHIPAE